MPPPAFCDGCVERRIPAVSPCWFRGRFQSAAAGGSNCSIGKRGQRTSRLGATPTGEVGSERYVYSRSPKTEEAQSPSKV